MILHGNYGESEKIDREGKYEFRVMTKNQLDSGREMYINELVLDKGIRNLSPALFRWNHLTALYLDNNNVEKLPPAISELIHLQKLDVSRNMLRFLPPEIGDLIQLREFSVANNYIRTLPYELGRLFQLQNFGILGNPLPNDILSLYHEPNGLKKLLEFMLDHLNVSATPPPPRPWISCANINRNSPTAVFTVMCYNVLCEKYATKNIYAYCPQWALNWEFRKKGILDEIRHYAADIIALQEVECEQYNVFFVPELARDGYEGIFKQKTRWKTMHNESERKRLDGCAIFWKPQKFKLVSDHIMAFCELATTVYPGCDDMMNRVHQKDNIAAAAVLELREGAFGPAVNNSELAAGQKICVVTAHIHWDPQFCDVKLIQTLMLVDQLRRLMKDQPQTQLLVCGDFNSLPDSGVIEYLLQGRIRSDHKDFQNLHDTYKKSLCKMISHNPEEEMHTHGFELKSVIEPEIMPFTNYTYDFKGMIDYIFYPRQTMKPLGFLGPMDSLWLKENKVIGCPHPHLPSDHFSLLVELAMPLPLGNLNALGSATNHSGQQSVGPPKSIQQQHFNFNPSQHSMNNFMTYPPPMNNGTSMHHQQPRL